MWEQPEEMAQDLKLSMKSTKKTAHEPGGDSSLSVVQSPNAGASWENISKKELIRTLILQAFLTLGKKTPSSPIEGNLFFDGWASALESVPTDALRSSFLDAIASNKPFTPGLVVQSYRERIGAKREEIKRKPQDGENPFPFHAKLREAGTERTYSFSLREPALCRDCGREAEVFKYFGPRKSKMLLCGFHGET